MAFVCRLTKDGEPDIDLFYSVTGWAMLEKGLMPNDPERRELWGGYLEDQLVRQEDGKREIPLKLQGEWASPDELIDAVNALEARLRDASHYRITGAGAKVFFEWQLHNATFPVRYPVLSGQIDKNELMNACGLMMDATGHREAKGLVSVEVTIVCENYWEATEIYTLNNLLDNPGFEEWNGGTVDSQPDCWADYEWVTMGTHTNNQETDIVAEGCEAVRIEVNGIGIAEYKGVSQDISARLQADTEYTYLAWVQNEAITNGLIGVRVRVAGVGDIATALNSGAANADYTRYDCQFTPTAAHIAAGVHAYAYILATADACIGIAHIDKALIMEGSDVPTGWMSSSYLMNHYDRDPGHINFLSVCDIPGEVEAEIKATVDLDDTTKHLRVAKRTRDNPCAFVWELNAVDAKVSADAPAYCIDSVLADGGLATPGGWQVAVTFATDKTMVRRCYWDITADLASYYGAFALAVVAKMEGTTDDCKMQIQGIDENNTQGNITSIAVGNTWWTLHDGWEVLSFPIGTHPGDNWGAGNNWRISLFASTNAPGAPTDDLQIACAFLIALDKAYMIGGNLSFGAGIADMIVQDMDGDRGLFAYIVGTDTYLSNLSVVGSYPLLTPKVENWLYFLTTRATNEYVYDDMYHVSLEYRPRGIFLRGRNP